MVAMLHSRLRTEDRKGWRHRERLSETYFTDVIISSSDNMFEAKNHTL